MREERAEIAVLGGGPAGAAAALGLAALGHEVAVAQGRATSRAQRESFSARVVAALESLGVDEALAAVGPPGARSVRWAGEARELPGEAQVERAAFDAGLLRDLERAAIRVIQADVRHVAQGADGVRVTLGSGATLAASFVVEARGRAAPGSRVRQRGPETVCVVQRWRAPRSDVEPRIAIGSLANGWVWIADDGCGGIALQLAVAARDAPPRSQLGASLDAVLRGDPFCRERLRGAAPEGDPAARPATPVLDGELVSDRTLRVGDAALAVDPLSGNGVFQALSTARVAPAVVHTLLRRPEHGALARRFYAERARDVFDRFARVSRDFYAQAAAVHGSAFWQERAAWPAPDADGPAGARLAIVPRPVVCDGWIEEREVVVTPERPLGTWRVAGVELAPLVRTLTARPGASGAAHWVHVLGALPAASREPVRAWLLAHLPPATSP